MTLRDLLSGVTRRRRVLASSAVLVQAVRLDWSDDASHQFVGGSASRKRVERTARRLKAYWWASPIRPVLSVVTISENEFLLHRRRRDCRSPDCAMALTADTRPVVA
ncbi:hypothetical protein AB0B31_10635 [Catellatospora citrea]|uniref:hypothetical protein n=1 Tax=Catellatospora citrea TaxID=53366 RepID=UPI0033FB98CE